MKRILLGGVIVIALLVPILAKSRVILIALPLEQIEQKKNAPSLWDGYALLKRICATESDSGPESEPRQFLPDGSILWGWQDDKIVKRDVGTCQINIKAHGDEISKLGLDVISNMDDNVHYAKILFDREGWHPWVASKKGWDPENMIR